MRFKRGDIVKVDWDSLITTFNRHIDNQENLIGRSHPSYKDLVKRRNLIENHRGMTAKVVGSYDYGSYINLKFDDGFEMGAEKGLLEKI
jgi:hypothetical protein